MDCPNCGTDNTADSKFCMTCGTKLEVVEEVDVATEVTEVQVGESSDPNPWLGDESVEARTDEVAEERAEEPIEEPAENPAEVPAEKQAEMAAAVAPEADLVVGLEPEPALEPEPEPELEPEPGTAENAPAAPESATSLLPPPPIGGESSWTSPDVAVGVPSSLVPDPGMAANWRVDPPPPGSYEPIQTEFVDAPVISGAASVSLPDPPGDTPSPAIVTDAGPADPHGIDRLMNLLSPLTRPHAELPVMIAVSHLGHDEQVEIIVPGLVDGEVGIVAVTPSRVLIASGRQWSPALVEFSYAAGLKVLGWQDETYAQLTFEGATAGQIDAIVDKSLAMDAARIIRERVADPDISG